jgi:hypothetical protein
MGAFGLLEDGNPYHVPPERFTETHPCVSVFSLAKEGLLVPGAQATLQMAGKGCVRATRTAGSLSLSLATDESGKIWIGDQPIAIGAHPSLAMPAFLCPLCGNIRYKLFEVGGRWACYRCHGLTHASRHVNRSIPNFHRLERLRRKVGASPAPFSLIAPRLKSHVRYHRVADEIRSLEERLVGHLGGIVHDLKRRINVRKAKGRW